MVMNVMNEPDVVDRKKPFPFCLIHSISTKYASITKVEGKYKEKRFFISAKNVWKARLELATCQLPQPRVTIATAELIIWADYAAVNDN